MVEGALVMSQRKFSLNSLLSLTVGLRRYYAVRKFPSKTHAQHDDNPTKQYQMLVLGVLHVPKQCPLEREEVPAQHNTLKRLLKRDEALGDSKEEDGDRNSSSGAKRAQRKVGHDKEQGI